MRNTIWIIFMVVAVNAFYHGCISAKSTHVHVDPFVSLTVSYLVAAGLSALLFFITTGRKNMFAEIGKIHWVSIAFGFAIVCLELVYLWVYRTGIVVNVDLLMTNIGLACVLLTMGVLLYQGAVSSRQVGGILLCMVGVYFVNR